MLGDDVVDADLAPGGGNGGHVGARLDLVGDDGVTSALELFHAPDLDDVRPRAHDVRAHGVEEVGQVHDVRLLGSVFDDGQAVGQGCGDEDVHGRTHGDHVQVDLRSVQAAGGGRRRE